MVQHFNSLVALQLRHCTENRGKKRKLQKNLSEKKEAEKTFLLTFQCVNHPVFEKKGEDWNGQLDKIMAIL